MHLLGLLGTKYENIEKRHHRLKASDALWICLRSCTLLNLSRFPFHARTGFFGGALAAFFRSWAVLGGLGALLGALGAVLGRSWAVLGVLGVFLGALGCLRLDFGTILRRF